MGNNEEEVKTNLLKENPWIEEAGFDKSNIIIKQLLTDEQKSDIENRC